MTKVLFKRKTSDEIATLPVEDGALIYNYETGATYLDYDDERIPTGGGMPTGDTFPIGAITSYAGSVAPTNWLICDGRAISRVTYSDLFNAIGTTYGSGDGNTTFNLPNLKGRVITGLDSSQTEFDTLGETGGNKVTKTLWNIFNNYHFSDGTGAYSDRIIVNDSQNTSTTDINYVNISSLQPYITLNYIIKAFQSSGTVADVSTTTTTSDTDTYSCNYINSMDKYSTNEIKTNKIWIDGKPIYRKVLSYSSSYANTGSRTITHNLGVDNYTNIVCGFLNYAGTTFPIPRIANDGNNVGISSISSNSLIIDVATAITSYSNLILVLEYTKTTD